MEWNTVKYRQVAYLPHRLYDYQVGLTDIPWYWLHSSIVASIHTTSAYFHAHYTEETLYGIK